MQGHVQNGRLDQVISGAVILQIDGLGCVCAHVLALLGHRHMAGERRFAKGPIACLAERKSSDTPPDRQKALSQPIAQQRIAELAERDEALVPKFNLRRGWAGSLEQESVGDRRSHAN